ncbi:hypothetical protein C8Q77DRAFT_776819 [Trametes polyzona]|nr:hypothetical protein C8Q77DRAFT_776819 [Trametes polyzona]
MRSDSCQHAYSAPSGDKCRHTSASGKFPVLRQCPGEFHRRLYTLSKIEARVVSTAFALADSGGARRAIPNDPARCLPAIGSGTTHADRSIPVFRATLGHSNGRSYRPRSAETLSHPQTPSVSRLRLASAPSVFSAALSACKMQDLIG